MNLGQTVHGGGEEIGRGVVVRVKFLIDVGAPQAEIGAEVDDLAALLQEGDREFRGDAVGQGEEDEPDLLGEQGGVGLGEPDGFGPGMVAEFGKDLGERLPGVLARGDSGEFDMGMGEEQAHEFLAGITGGADDADFDGFAHLKS